MEFTARTADQEVDTVEICPDHPEYMIIGTYALVKKDDPRDYEAQTRRGSLQVMTVHSTFTPRYAGMLAPSLDRVDFPSAVLDLHFHPADHALLGVATSNGEMHFFRFTKSGDVLGRRVVTKLIPLGVVTVAAPDLHGLVPLITQFAWLPDIRTHGVVGVNDVHDISWVATTSFGQTRLLETSIPAIQDAFDKRLGDAVARLEPTWTDIHTHDLEAWTVATLVVPSMAQTAGTSTERMILSGGDDSALISSTVELRVPSSNPLAPSIAVSDTPRPVSSLRWKDRRTHSAGVVSILPLPPLQSSVPDASGPDHPPRIPVLTGSYDERLRVFEIDPQTYRAHLQTEMKFNGGVWRLKMLDQYSAPDHDHHTLILASLMHGGAMILQLTCSAPSPAAARSWTISPVMTFRKGHESMVYCCDARREPDEADDHHQGAIGPSPPPRYTVVSTSFYDMKICTWTFVDGFKP